MLLHEAADGGGEVGAEVAEGLADEGPAGGARGKVRPLLLGPVVPPVGAVAFGYGACVEGEEGQQDEGEEEEELAGYGGHHGTHELPTDHRVSSFAEIYFFLPLALPDHSPALLVFVCVWRERKQEREGEERAKLKKHFWLWISLSASASFAQGKNW